MCFFSLSLSFVLFCVGLVLAPYNWSRHSTNWEPAISKESCRCIFPSRSPEWLPCCHAGMKLLSCRNPVIVLPVSHLLGYVSIALFRVWPLMSCTNIILTFIHETGILIMFVFLDKLQARCRLSHHQIWLHPPVRLRNWDLHLHEQDQWRDHFCHCPSWAHCWYHWGQQERTGIKKMFVHIPSSHLTARTCDPHFFVYILFPEIPTCPSK